MPATVTLPLEELDEFRSQIRTANETIAKLKKEMIEHRLESSGDDVQKLLAFCRAALEIVGYAVANLHPEFSKKWPYEALRTVSFGIDALPDVTPFESEMAFELRKFAIECETWETRRKQMGERYVPPPVNPATAVKSIAELAKETDDKLHAHEERTIADYMPSALPLDAKFCEHANEVPSSCSCPENCYCKTHTCAPTATQSCESDPARVE